MINLEVQMRNNDGGLAYRGSIETAFLEAQADPSIWKISWIDSVTKELVRLVRMHVDGKDIWVYDPIISH